jgi:hypothetical protein
MTTIFASDRRASVTLQDGRIVTVRGLGWKALRDAQLTALSDPAILRRVLPLLGKEKYTRVVNLHRATLLEHGVLDADLTTFDEESRDMLAREIYALSLPAATPEPAGR